MNDAIEQPCEQPQLISAHIRSGLGRYLSDVWNRRSYITQVPRHELAAEETNTVLGSGWHLLNPILLVCIYYLIFGVLLDISRGEDNYITFLAIGVFVFQYSQKSITSGGYSVVKNIGLIRSIRFPRAVLPLSATAKQLWLHLPAVVIFLSVAILTGEPVRLSWALIPLLMVWQTLLTAGLTLIAARAVHTSPDLANLLPFAFRILFYGSGVLFSLERRASGTALYLFQFNPFYDIVELHRAAIFGKSVASEVVVSMACWTLVSVSFGLWWFHRDEAFYGAKN